METLWHRKLNCVEGLWRKMVNKTTEHRECEQTSYCVAWKLIKHWCRRRPHRQTAALYHPFSFSAFPLCRSLSQAIDATSHTFLRTCFLFTGMMKRWSMTHWSPHLMFSHVWASRNPTKWPDSSLLPESPFFKSVRLGKIIFSIKDGAW